MVLIAPDVLQEKMSIDDCQYLYSTFTLFNISFKLLRLSDIPHTDPNNYNWRPLTGYKVKADVKYTLMVVVVVPWLFFYRGNNILDPKKAMPWNVDVNDYAIFLFLLPIRLLKEGVDPNQRHRLGWTALMVAAMNRQHRSVCVSSSWTRLNKSCVLRFWHALPGERM